MLEIGSFRTKDCQGLTRRAFLRAGAALPLAYGLSGLDSGPLKAAESAKAKSVLLVWLGGGPSHLDLFDPKPNGLAEYRGPLATIATRTTGMRFTELLPKLADRLQRIARTSLGVNTSHQQLQALNDKFDIPNASGPELQVGLALSLLADMVFDLAFDPVDLLHRADLEMPWINKGLNRL